MEPVLTAVKCPNCQASVEQNFCPACGQKKTEERLHVRKLIVDFIHNSLGTDAGIFFTIGQLVSRPGEAVREYIQGRRMPYLKPVQFFLLALALYILLSELLHISPMELGKSINHDLGLEPSDNNPRQVRLMNEFYQLFNQNIKIIFTILVPITAATQGLVYRKERHTFAELMVFGLYVSGTSFILYNLQTVFLYFKPAAHLSNIFFIVYSLLFFAYFIWAIYQFHNGRGWKALIKAMFAYFLSYVFYFTLTAIVGIIFASILSQQP